MSQVPSEFLSVFLNFSDPELRCEFSVIGFGFPIFISEVLAISKAL